MPLLFILLSLASLALPINSKCVGEIDLIFVIDSSMVLSEDAFAKEIKMLSDIAKSFELGDNITRIGAVSYSYSGEKLFDLGDHSDTESVVKALSEAKYIGSSANLHRGLNIVNFQQMFLKDGGRRQAKDVVLAVLSGKSARPFASIDAAASLKAKGVQIITIPLDSEPATLYVARQMSSCTPVLLTFQAKNDIDRLCLLAGGSLV